MYYLLAVLLLLSIPGPDHKTPDAFPKDYEARAEKMGVLNCDNGNTIVLTYEWGTRETEYVSMLSAITSLGVIYFSVLRIRNNVQESLIFFIQNSEHEESFLSAFDEWIARLKKDAPSYAAFGTDEERHDCVPGIKSQ